MATQNDDVVTPLSASEKAICESELEYYSERQGHGPNLACLSDFDKSRLSFEFARRRIFKGNKDVVEKELITNLAALNFFRLTDWTLPSLDHRFSEEEMRILLSLGFVSSSGCDPVYRLSATLRAAYGIEDDNAPTKINQLALKLNQLTDAQEITLLDVCQQMWNTGEVTTTPLRKLAVRFGLVLAEYDMDKHGLGDEYDN